jgi:acetyl-CoA acetyltransferase
MVDGMQVCVAAGKENISAVQDRIVELLMCEKDENALAQQPNLYMPMLPTAEHIVRKYKISRLSQDEYALQSQLGTASAQRDGKFNEEVVPVTATRRKVDQATKIVSCEEVTPTADEGIRPDTTLEALQALQPVIEGGTITAGHASQLSDARIDTGHGQSLIGHDVAAGVLVTKDDHIGACRRRPVGARRQFLGGSRHPTDAQPCAHEDVHPQAVTTTAQKHDVTR